MCDVDDGVVALVFEVVWVVVFLWFDVVVSWDVDVCVSLAFWVDTLVDGRDVWTEEVDDVSWDTTFGVVTFSFDVWGCSDDVWIVCDAFSWVGTSDDVWDVTDVDDVEFVCGEEVCCSAIWVLLCVDALSCEVIVVETCCVVAFSKVVFSEKVV